MKNYTLVQYFVDGAEVDFDQMLSLQLIRKQDGGYVLTQLGQSYLRESNPL